VVLNLGVRLPGESINFWGSASFYVLYNIGSLINKFTNKYICLYNLFHVRRLETKDDYDFERGVE